MAVYLKSAAEIEVMRQANQIVARTLAEVRQAAKPGVTTLELDELAEEGIRKAGAKPAFKGYQGSGPYPFPATLCTSLNEEVVHGIPSNQRKLKAGDILSVDCGVLYDRFYGDSAVTIPIGTVSPVAERLMQVTQEALELAIQQARPGNRLSDIGAAIQRHVEGAGFSVVRDFVGHGIGRALHEEPQVPHYRSAGHNERLRPGLVIAIEPMINEGTWQVEAAADGWTQVTRDRKLSAHFEHSVAIGGDGPIVLSKLAQGELS
ncbi:MAG TPA: type I methionyl aminopeptidase [Myxococcota bacterium]|nr:type I methionyl aminopeptidase [Myxococcota bacterium]HRY94449.1 type I methionyl aminopeptidase [Myxococcota bacterium]